MGILSVLFSQSRCVFCHRVIRNPTSYLICENCVASLPYTEKGTIFPGNYYSCCYAPFYYEGSVRDSLRRFKDKNATGYAETYGKVLSDYIHDVLSDKYDIISWVPLSADRLKERGYDQSMLLALATALELEDVAVSTLEMHVNVDRQSTVGSAESRKANVSGAYRTVDPELVAGKRILLIDDIVSSGSTLSECAKTLLEAGATNVLCVALAMNR